MLHLCHLPCVSFLLYGNQDLLLEAPARQGCRWKPAGARVLCVNISIWRGFQEAFRLWGLNATVRCNSLASKFPFQQTQILGQSAPDGCSLSILRAKKKGEDWRVSGWVYRLRGNEKKNWDKAGCQRLGALADQLKFINNYFQVPMAVCTWFHVNTHAALD